MWRLCEPPPPPLCTALTASRSDAVPAVSAKPCPLPPQRCPVLSAVALPAGWVGRPVRGVRGGAAVARQPTVLGWRAFRVGRPRLTCLCAVLRRARLSVCRHHGTCRCVLVATMRAVAGRTWGPSAKGGRWESVRRMFWGVGRVRRQWGLAGRWRGGVWLGRCFSGPLWGMLMAFSGPLMGLPGAHGTYPGDGASSRACPGAMPWTFSATSAQRECILCRVAAAGGCQCLTWSSLSLCLGCFSVFPPLFVAAFALRRTLHCDRHAGYVCLAELVCW